MTKPKKDPEENAKENVNVRITTKQKEIWTNYADDNHFANLSTMIRWCVEEIVEKGIVIKQKDNNNNNVKQRISEIDIKYNELMKSQQEILKLIAQKAPKTEPKQDELYKNLIINLLKEKPRDETELQALLSTPEVNIPEVIVLKYINELMEASKIRLNNKQKFELIK